MKDTKAKTFKGDEIENWAKEYHKMLQSAENRDKLSDYAANIIFHSREMESDPRLKELIEDEKGNDLVNLIYKRIKYCHSYEIDPISVLLLSFMTDSPGGAVMITNYLQYMAYKHNTRKLDMFFLCRIAFPFGNLNEKAAHMMWNKQKGYNLGIAGVDNLLDYSAAAESIHFK